MDPRPVPAAASVAGPGAPPRDAASAVGGEVVSSQAAPAAMEAIPVIDVPEGLPGYPDARAFVLERLDDLGALGTLRSLDEQGPSFLVVPPAVWFPDYEPVLDAVTCAGLGLTEAGDALLLLVVTMGESPAEATANLVAPFVVNARTRRGAQVVLSGTAYSMRQPLTGA